MSFFKLGEISANFPQFGIHNCIKKGIIYKDDSLYAIQTDAFSAQLLYALTYSSNEVLDDSIGIMVKGKNRDSLAIHDFIQFLCLFFALFVFFLHSE